MNEKIKQLWEQSKTSGVHSKFGEYDKYSAEKFAELIVRECAEYITEYFPHSRYEARQMKKHFGVEE